MSERMIRNLLEQDAYFTAYSMGVDIGTEKIQREMVIKMNNKNEPLDKICEYADLTLDEVKNIIENSQNENS